MFKARLLHVNILTGNTHLSDQVEEFYTTNFGLKIIRRNKSNVKADRRFMANDGDPDGMLIEIIGDLTEVGEPTPFNSKAGPDFLARHGPGLDHICFEVDDIVSACNTLKAKGIQIEIEPYEFQGFSKIAWLKDPVGVRIELIEFLNK